MVETGIDEFDSLPGRMGLVDIEYLRYVLVSTQHPSVFEKVVKYFLKLLKERREKKHEIARKKLEKFSQEYKDFYQTYNEWLKKQAHITSLWHGGNT